MKQTHSRTNLYRLKSNPTTIVMRLGDRLQKIVWSRTMAEYNVDNTWMISRFNLDNVIKLSKEESQEIKEQIRKWFKKNSQQIKNYYVNPI